eukprot:319361-Hanusia_phi.AAC.2
MFESDKQSKAKLRKKTIEADDACQQVRAASCPVTSELIVPGQLLGLQENGTNLTYQSSDFLSKATHEDRTLFVEQNQKVDAAFGQCLCILIASTGSCSFNYHNLHGKHQEKQRRRDSDQLPGGRSRAQTSCHPRRDKFLHPHEGDDMTIMAGE